MLENGYSRRKVYICYFDESGDPGYINSLTSAYSLGGVLVQDKSWLRALDDIIRFRRFLRRTFGLQMRDELKASYLIHNNGPFEKLNLGDEIRIKIYDMALKLLTKMNEGQGIHVFAVVIDKKEMVNRERQSENPLRIAWDKATERLERFTDAKRDTCTIFPDEGNHVAIRTIIRKKRRISIVPSRYGTPPLSRPASLVVEDPSMRISRTSYFIQLADLIAYAAHRAIYPEPWFDNTHWEKLGNVRIAGVNKYSGGPRGIKLWPPQVGK